MQIVWVLLVFVRAATFKPVAKTSKIHETKIGLIANGKIYDPLDYPYIVRLITFGTVHGKISLCTGSLLSPLFVLTAAHCTDGKIESNIKVFHSTSLPTNHRGVQRVYQHPNFKLTPTAVTADISLLKLKKSFDNILRYIILSGHPSQFVNGAELKCVIIGFGVTEKSNTPNNEGYRTYTQVKLGSRACELSSNYSLTAIEITSPEFLCSKPDKHMVCPGDSGGPLICRGFQYGIASHGYNFVNTNGAIVCGSTSVQTRHLFVYAYRDWISATLNTAKSISRMHHKLYTIISVTLTLFVVM